MAYNTLWEMTKNKKKNRLSPGHRSKTQQNKEEILAQKDLQEVRLSKDEDFLQRKQRLSDQTQDYMYSQSTKFSSVSRQLILGIIGTVWVVTYKDHEISIPYIILNIGLFLSIVYLCVDVLHYYWDSNSYQKELYNIDTYKSENDLSEKHEPFMDKVNIRSHRFIFVKFWLLMVVTFMFFIGMLFKLQPIKDFIVSLFSK